MAKLKTSQSKQPLVKPAATKPAIPHAVVPHELDNGGSKLSRLLTAIKHVGRPASSNRGPRP